VKESLNAMLAHRFDAAAVDVYHGTGEFEDPHTIGVRDGNPEDRGEAAAHGVRNRIRGAHILIATGSYPLRPEIFPFDGKEVYDSNTILDLKELPRRIAVVGAGTIGCE